ncbi:aldo/keto reductase [Actinoplanes sp. TBRC 11911]|uniref:aldo/keto reductase n=1 Tax=Actinoplanes sp. TBRC 11911 TaxID=2729386 RepID=UPI00145F65E8|nr:aldo/keto reductase [Actinoplanes sp. TBRC 11911]NMO49913.1 aldo/keto reductase [Actinoplanes sp. TBRC 11911]
MKYRLLGRTGVWVSELSLGTMTFGGRGHPVYGAMGALGPDEADRFVGAALDAGVNLIDTADAYANGESEELLGRVIRQRRADVLIASKVIAPLGPGVNDHGLTRLHIMRALEESLRRLRTDYLDVYYVHNWDPLTPLEETLGVLDDVVRQGKVRYLGAANLAAWQISKGLGLSALHDRARFVVGQTAYSLVTRDAEHELIPMGVDAGLGLTVTKPLADGLLTGKFSNGPVPDSRRGRIGSTLQLRVDEQKAVRVVDVLRTVAERHATTSARVAIAWLLAQPAVTSVTLGARTPDQLTENLTAGQLTLTAQDLAELDEASRPAPPYTSYMQSNFAPIRTPAAHQLDS